MPPKSAFLVLVLSGITLLLIAFQFAPKRDALALGAGYLLFSLNYVLLASLMQRLLAGSTSVSSRGILSLISGLKFFGLVGLLYVLLVVYRLSGFYLAAGALASLVILSSFLYRRYVRTLSASRLP